ncbi:MAG TPA: phosphodiester glycosidase family protein [bacterium]
MMKSFKALLTGIAFFSLLAIVPVNRALANDSYGMILRTFPWVFVSWDDDMLLLRLDGILDGTYRMYELDSPPRLVIQIPAMVCNPDIPVYEEYNFSGVPVLTQLRVNCNEEGTTLVLESKAALFYEVMSQPDSRILDVACLLRFRQAMEQIILDEGAYYYAKRYVTPSGQRMVHAVILDPAKSRLRPRIFFASDTTQNQISTVQNIVDGSRSAVGINGGYFMWPGISLSMVIQDGMIKSPPVFYRPALMIYENERYEIGYPDIYADITSSSGLRWTTENINRHPGFGQLALLTPGHPARIREDMPGLKAVLFNEFVEYLTEDDIEDFSDRTILWSRGGNPPLALLGVQEQVDIEIKQDDNGPQILHSIQGGPMLTLNGAVHLTVEENEIGRDIANGRSARTAVGVDNYGRLYLVTVESPTTGRSIGATLQELAWTMLDLGATSAMNLDGGSSTSMAFGYMDEPEIGLPHGSRSVATALVLIDESGRLQGDQFRF